MRTDWTLSPGGTAAATSTRRVRCPAEMQRPVGDRVKAGDPTGRRAWSAVARPELAVAGVLLAVAAVAWVWTAARTAGMDAGLWTYPADLGLYLGTWVVMMAAMMFPSVVPTALAYERTARIGRARRTAFAMTGIFVAGYLAVWSAAGLVA